MESGSANASASMPGHQKARAVSLLEPTAAEFLLFLSRRNHRCRGGALCPLRLRGAAASALHLPGTGALRSAYYGLCWDKRRFEMQKLEILFGICFSSLNFIELSCLDGGVSFPQAVGVPRSSVGRSVSLAGFHLRVPELLQEGTEIGDGGYCSASSAVLTDGRTRALCLGTAKHFSWRGLKHLFCLLEYTGCAVTNSRRAEVTPE